LSALAPLKDRMIDGMERIWKELAMAQSRYYLVICLEGLRKTMENIGQNFR
jgi:hypothetical protein